MIGWVFIPGLELSRRFYREAVWPAVVARFGDVPHSAARVGGGSEVLGFDTARSADHEWGPRVQLFLADGDDRGPAIHAALREDLPKEFLGHPTHFVGDGIGVMTPTNGPVDHRVEVTTPAAWFAAHLGFDPRAGVSTADWLGTPAQTLAEVTGGAVFHDPSGVLSDARERLAWYPDDVWRYVLACQWQRLGQEEAFVGRCGEVGDELGSAIVAARQVRDLVRLALLAHRRYPPYAKWLGSAFRLLPTDLAPVLRAVLAATDWHTREAHLAAAYTALAEAHNALGLTAPLDPSTGPYHHRPYRVLRTDRFARALIDGITDPALRRRPLIGAIDQFADNTDLVSNVPLRRNVLRHSFE
ncbi:DUF4037 domain-containing protein [Saccharothrix obliqua]|uniref:DUF4037 domain-containing protein n=1 Tax=Saccharothrix obliqua TaxID=2861747 RepID=UPI001C607722|nr:DUF4037 domain-containing protein [Saccharothrix obliqua]MBW4721961.1 DUF4037 domain-containing protein [Saccharothrix obliqua]